MLICYRRHDEYATSLYSTNILSDRFRWSFPEFLSRCAPLFDYAAQLALIREVFPDTDMRTFDDLRRDLVPSFCSWARLPVLPTAALVTKVTPDPRVIVWLQRILATEPEPSMAAAARGFALSAAASDRFREAPRASLWPSAAARAGFLAGCIAPSPGVLAPVPAEALNPVTAADLDAVEAAFVRWRRYRPARAVRKGLARMARWVGSAAAGRE